MPSPIVVLTPKGGFYRYLISWIKREGHVRQRKQMGKETQTARRATKVLWEEAAGCRASAEGVEAAKGCQGVGGHAAPSAHPALNTYCCPRRAKDFRGW